MKPIIKVPLTNGAIAGVLGSFFLIGLYYIGRHPFLIPVYVDSRIFLFGFFIFFTLKELRDYHHGGSLYFWEGLIASFFFVISFSIISCIFIAGFGLWIPEFLSSYISLTLGALKNLPAQTIEKIGKQVYERNLMLLPSTNAFDLVILYFWQSLVIGTFISIILSVIVRRQPKT